MDETIRDDVFIYFVHLPNGINELVTPCSEGYTVYIDKDLPYEKKINAYYHAISHIKDEDFTKHNVQRIEQKAHAKEA